MNDEGAGQCRLPRSVNATSADIALSAADASLHTTSEKE